MIQLTCRDFSEQARQAAQTAPVFISDNGAPAYVLLTHRQYCQLTAQRSAAQALTPPPELAAALDTIGLDLPERSPQQRRQTDLGA